MTGGRGRSLRVDIAGDAEKLKRELAAARRAVREAERDLARMGGTQDDIARSGDRMTQSLSRQERVIGNLQRNWRGYAAGITAVAAAGGAALYTANQLVEVARQEEQARARVTAIFEGETAAIQTWASQADDAIGLSQRAALQAAGDFGNLFDQLGFGRQQIVGMSTDIVNLAADYSAFHDADITQVIQAQSAAFRGEYDALQRFVPTINAARVEQKAMEMGLAASTRELTVQDKALATYRIMMDESGKAVGAFARESDELTGQQARLDAQMENLRANIGRALIPAFTDATEVMNDFLDAHAEDIARGIASGVDAIATSLGDVQSVIAAIRESGPVRITFELATGEVPTLGEGDGTTYGDLFMDSVRAMNPFSRGMLPWSAAADAFGGPETPFLPSAERELARFNAARPGSVVNRPLTPEEEAAVRDFERATSNMNTGPIDLNALVRRRQEAARVAAGGRGGGGGAARVSAEERAAQEDQRRFLAEIESINRDFQRALRDAHFEGGREQVETVRAQQAEMLAEVSQKANELRGVLGVDLAEAMGLAYDTVKAVAEAEKALAEQREEEARRLRFEAFGVTATLIDRGVGVEDALRLGREALGIDPVPVQTGPNQVTQNISVTVEDGSPAAIQNATTLAGIQLAHELRNEGL